jgi:hypothetical protein
MICPPNVLFIFSSHSKNQTCIPLYQELPPFPGNSSLCFTSLNLYPFPFSNVAVALLSVVDTGCCRYYISFHRVCRQPRYPRSLNAPTGPLRLRLSRTVAGLAKAMSQALVPFLSWYSIRSHGSRETSFDLAYALPFQELS